MRINRNTHLHAAKKVKNDEFYTKLIDVENELHHYKTHVKGKIVYCNCDDPNWSSFYKYFTLNFKHLGLKKVIATHYSKDISSDPAYMEECILGSDGNIQVTRTTLKEDGDFRSSECIALLHQADIVCTNPPFPLFREYIGLLVKMKKSFLVLGPQNAITYKEIFPLIMNNDVWLGITKPKVFSTPEGEEKTFGNICWYTNLLHSNRTQKIRLWKTYNAEAYPSYDNYDAIEVGKVAEIPVDYDGVMGVPITFLGKYNPDQFEIVGSMGAYAPDGFSLCSNIYVAGAQIYKRIAIKLK